MGGVKEWVWTSGWLDSRAVPVNGGCTWPAAVPTCLPCPPPPACRHQAAVFGDVDGDGALEAVVTTFSGHVHVLDAATGKPKGPFPFRAFGKVSEAWVASGSASRAAPPPLSTQAPGAAILPRPAAFLPLPRTHTRTMSTDHGAAAADQAG